MTVAIVLRIYTIKELKCQLYEMCAQELELQTMDMQCVSVISIHVVRAERVDNLPVLLILTHLNNTVIHVKSFLHAYMLS